MGRWRRFLSKLIPSRGLRGAVREGMVREYFSRRRALESTPKNQKFPYYLAAAAIVKNEAPYLAEWIEYHLLAGVEKFHIYDNESTDGTREAMAPYVRDGVAEYIYWPGRAQQTPVYMHALERLRDEARWLAFIDADEFIVPMAAPDIPSILKEFEGEAGLCINWLVYGDNGRRRKTKGLVIERFTAHSLPEFERNRVFKTIIDPRRAYFMNPHICKFVGMNTRAVNSDGVPVSHVGRPPALDKIRINHYWTKTYEEFQIKKFRGDVAHPGLPPKDDAEFHYHNRNDVKGDRTMEKWAARVKAALKKRNAASERAGRGCQKSANLFPAPRQLP